MVGVLVSGFAFLILQILVGNRCDEESKRVVPTSDGQELALRFNMPFFETSAKLNANVNEVRCGPNSHAPMSPSSTAAVVITAHTIVTAVKIKGTAVLDLCICFLLECRRARWQAVLFSWSSVSLHVHPTRAPCSPCVFLYHCASLFESCFINLCRLLWLLPVMLWV